MTVQDTFEASVVAQPKPAWSAVLALTLCVATLIASEFMPVSLLTPIATDLRITDGQAGQAIAVSGIFAVSAFRQWPAASIVDRFCCRSPC